MVAAGAGGGEVGEVGAGGEEGLQVGVEEIFVAEGKGGEIRGYVE